MCGYISVVFYWRDSMCVFKSSDVLNDIAIQGVFIHVDYRIMEVGEKDYSLTYKGQDIFTGSIVDCCKEFSILLEIENEC